MCPFQKAENPSSEKMQREACNIPQYFPSGLCEDIGSICSYEENQAVITLFFISTTQFLMIEPQRQNMEPNQMMF